MIVRLGVSGFPRLAARADGPSWLQWCALIGVATLVLGSGCVGHARGYPLYSPEGKYITESDVAKLYGEFSTIDGTSVEAKQLQIEVAAPRRRGRPRGARGAYEGTGRRGTPEGV